MSRVKILRFPNKLLSTPCKEVQFPLKADDYDLIYEMKNTLMNITGFYHKRSLAISANQVGGDKRMMIICKFPTNQMLKYKFLNIIINPKVVEVSQEKVLKWEGCLSDDKYMVLVERHKKIKVKYYNEHATEINADLGELHTRLFLHELDHLDGKNYHQNAIEKIEIAKLQDELYYENWHSKQNQKNLLI